MNLSLETKRSKFVEDLGIVTGLNKDIDVLCRPPQPGVCVDRKTTPDHEREFGVFENLQDFCIEGMSRGIRLILHNFSIEKVTDIQGIYRAITLCLIFLIASTAQAQICTQWTEAVRIGELQNQLQE